MRIIVEDRKTTAVPASAAHSAASASSTDVASAETCSPQALLTSASEPAAVRLEESTSDHSSRGGTPPLPLQPQQQEGTPSEQQHVTANSDSSSRPSPDEQGPGKRPALHDTAGNAANAAEPYDNAGSPSAAAASSPHAATACGASDDTESARLAPAADAVKPCGAAAMGGGSRAKAPARQAGVAAVAAAATALPQPAQHYSSSSAAAAAASGGKGHSPPRSPSRKASSTRGNGVPFPMGSGAAVAAAAVALQGNADAHVRFERALRGRGWRLLPQDGDGNCLFRAVSVHVYGDPGMHSDIRKKCVSFMRGDREHFQNYITEDFEGYMERKQRDGVYGNNPEIQAISELFNRPIEVYVPERGLTPLNIFHGGYRSGNAPIRLLYSGQSHYDAIVDPSEASVGQGLGVPGMTPESAHRQTLQANIFASDLETTELEIQQAAITASLQSYARDAARDGMRKNPKRQRRAGESDAGGGGSSGGGGGGSSSGAGGGGSSSSGAAASAAASHALTGKAPASGIASGGAGGESAADAWGNNYPLAVQELVMNGFPLDRVQRAYDLVGDSVEDLLALLLQS